VAEHRLAFVAVKMLREAVSKRVACRYKSGSCVAWVKVKNPAYERR
jgi:hypothetical protein